MPSAGLTPAWSAFQTIAAPSFDACARLRSSCFDDHVLVLPLLAAPAAISAQNGASSQSRH
jgi:hypothetical protein